MKKQGITKSVARYIEKVNAKELPDKVIEKAQNCLIDYLGACFVGSTAKMSQNIFTLVRTFFSRGNCPLIGTDIQSNVLGATWGNGVSGSACDYDDGHRAPLREGLSNEVLGHAAGHPGAVVIPSALSFAFDKSVNGVTLLVSIIAGYEISLRFAASRKTNTVLANVTGNWGVFAAAVSAGKILGLKGEKLENVFGVAASNLINGPKQTPLRDMSMIKESIGWSGVTGSISAIMAQAGITGIHDVLDNGQFFGRTFFEDLGENYHIMNVYFKPHSCCRMLHPAIDAAITLKHKYHINIEEIKNIVVETSMKAKQLDNRQPRTIEEAQYSFPFCMAAALKYEKVTPEVINEKEFFDPVIMDLSKKTSLKLDEKQDKDSEVETLFPRKTAARVIIMTSEKQYSTYVECPKGDTGNPLTRIELIEKFKESSRKFLSEENAQNLVNLILNLDECENLEKLRPLLVVKPLI